MPDGSAGMGPVEAPAGPDPLVGEDRLRVVFGTGQVGYALAAVLAVRGLTVRVVSRHRPPELADGIDWRAADPAGHVMTTKPGAVNAMTARLNAKAR